MTTIQRGNDRLFYLSLVEVFKTINGTDRPEPLLFSSLEGVGVELMHDDCGATFTPPFETTPEGLIRLELTREAQEEHGTGLYLVKVTARVPSSDHHDGYRHISHTAPLCRVVELLAGGESPSPEPATPLELVVLSALKGADGPKGDQGERGRDGERGPKGEDGRDGAPAPPPHFEYRHDPVSGHTYLYANGVEILTESGERLPIRKHIGELITTTRELLDLDMRPALYSGRNAVLMRGFLEKDRDTIRGRDVSNDTAGVVLMVALASIDDIGPGWQPPTRVGYYSSSVVFYFKPITTQPIYGLLANRERKINLVVRFRLHAKGRAVLSESNGSSVSIECEPNEIYDMAFPMYVNTAQITFSAFTSMMDAPNTPMMTLLDFRFVEVAPTR